MRFTRTIPVLFGLALVAMSTRASAQCPSWSRGFEVPGLDGTVFTTCMFDSGNGPLLTAGGNFRLAGNTPSNFIAQWNGSTWSDIGGDCDNVVRALAEWNDGSGTALFAAGSFQRIGSTPADRIAKWNGTTWQPIPGILGGTAHALQVFDDGTGPALFIGGSFFVTSGGTQNVAKWNGTTMSSIGAGVPGTGGGTVFDLAVYDSGGGPRLYAAGVFQGLGGMNSVACWTGSTWAAVGSGLPSSCTIYDLCVFDDGNGPRLYAIGNILTVNGVAPAGIVSWDGTNWSSVGGGVGIQSGAFCALGVFDDGTGSSLYAGGPFLSTGGQLGSGFLQWNGGSWLSLPGLYATPRPNVCSLESHLIAGVRRFVAGGEFVRAGSAPVANIALWSASTWGSIGTGNGLDDVVRTLHSHDDGSGTGPRLYAGGIFQRAGTAATSCIASWNGTSWQALGTGIPPGTFTEAVRAIATHDEGAGPRLFVAGAFNVAGGVPVANVARWDGSNWAAVGSQLGPDVFALASWNDGSGPALYAGGSFTTIGGVPAAGIAKWNGTTWTTVSTGFGTLVRELLVWNDGTGNALYACGNETNLVGRVAKWTGSTWLALPDPGGRVYSMAVYDDGTGSGEKLYVSIGDSVRRLEGSSWTTVGGMITGNTMQILALRVFDDGTGPALYAAGSFSGMTGLVTNNIARYRDGTWSEIGIGVNQTVNVLAVHDDGSGPGLFAGGRFTSAGGKPSYHVARLKRAPSIGTSLCSGDGVDPSVGVGCPCGNTGAPGHGCANFAVSGVQLCATESPFPNSIMMTGTGLVPYETTVLLFAGTSRHATGSVFGDGIRCVFGTLRRLAVRTSPGSTVTFTVAGDPPGSTSYYQIFYRDAVSFCTAATFNVSSALRVVW